MLHGSPRPSLSNKSVILVASERKSQFVLPLFLALVYLDRSNSGENAQFRNLEKDEVALLRLECTRKVHFKFEAEMKSLSSWYEHGLSA